MKTKKQIEDAIARFDEEFNNLSTEMGTIDLSDEQAAGELNIAMMENVIKTKTLQWVVSK